MATSQYCLRLCHNHLFCRLRGMLYQYASSSPDCTAAKVRYFSAISVCVLIFRLYCSESSVFQCYISMRPHFPTVLQQKFGISVLYQYASSFSGCTAANVSYFSAISACVLSFRLYCSKRSVFQCYISMHSHALTLFVLQI